MYHYFCGTKRTTKTAIAVVMIVYNNHANPALTTCLGNLAAAAAQAVAGP